MLGFFYALFLAKPPKLSIFSHDICFDFRLNHNQNKKNLFFFFKKRKNIYPIVDKLIWFILIFHVSTVITERAFSAMKIVKTRFRNRMDDDFLANYLIVYIVKEIIKRFTINMISDNFYSIKER
jgi:hypothetical protein